MMQSQESAAIRAVSSAALRSLLGALATAGVLAAGCTPDATKDRPNVVLVTIDTLRADFVHAYGFAQPTTPKIDALAARGALFELAFAASTATVPSHASIMTSRNVREHSVGAQNGPTRLEGLTTLAERFRDAGYDTAAFVSNVVLKSRSGLDRGFERYDDDLPESEANRAMFLERTAAETGVQALAWLSEPRDAPFFLWVHLQDPHGPYAPPSPYDVRVPELSLRTERPLPVLRANRGRGGLPAYQVLGPERRASRYAGLYAGEIAYADTWVGRLLEAAESASERPLVVLLTADHGESLDESGFFFQHGHSTTPEQARVPLVLVAPGVPPGRLTKVVHHVDIAPTLLEFAGLAPLELQSGISLARQLLHGAAWPVRAVLTDIGSEVTAYDEDGYVTVRISRPDVAPDASAEVRAGAIAGQKLAWQRFDRVGPLDAVDPWKMASGPAQLLAEEVVSYLSAEAPLVPALAMSDSDIARLRALGYLPPETTVTDE